MSRYTQCEVTPPIEVFHLNTRCISDPFDKKVNLTVGAYRTAEGKPWVLPVVKNAELQMANDPTLNHEYLPVTGLQSFSDAAIKLVLGENSKAIGEGRVAAVRALSGTGSLRLAAEFIRKFGACDVAYVSSPTWGNHNTIFLRAGFKEIKNYRYWNAQGRCLDINGMLEDLSKAPEGAAIILHGVAHNPTGVDPTPDQWQKIAAVLKERKLIPVVDIAYQGFASGDLDKDAFAPRHIEKQGMEFFVCQSFAKNFGLYNERCGCCSVILADSDAVPRVKSQMQGIIRPMYSNPPAHGARVVDIVLHNPQMLTEWKECLKTMSGRIISMRQGLYDRLKSLGTPGTWEHIISQIGMFSFTGLSRAQSDTLIEKYHVYLLRNGRINMCGLNENNLDYVANAIDAVVRNVPGN